MVKRNLPFIQNIVVPQRMGIRLSRPCSPMLPSRNLYLSLRLMSQESSVERIARLRQVGFHAVVSEHRSLTPGETYTLRLEVTPVSQSQGSLLPSSEDVRGLLICSSSAVSFHSSDECSIPLQNREHFFHDFLIEIAPICPKEVLEFHFVIIEDHRPVVLGAVLDILVEGTYIAPDPTLFDACFIDLTTLLPDQTAILHVVQHNDRTIQITGWSKQVPLDQVITLRDFPHNDLARFIEGKVDPDTIRGAVRSFWRRGPVALLKWFKRLQQNYGTPFTLIIADHTDGAIPWELIEVGVEDDTYLGIIANIARWIPVQFRTTQVLLKGEPFTHKGQIITYLDDKEVTDITRERHNLERYTTNRIDIHSLSELNSALSLPQQAIGFLYLACHGIFTVNDRHKIAVGSLPTATERLSALDLENIAPHSSRSLLMFVNACHSARLMLDTFGLYGLPEVALARFAYSYIGTMGPVGSRYAATIAHKILKAAANDPTGVSVTDILRQIRTEAVANLLQNPSDPEAWRMFLYSFMYVYYGNPFSRLVVRDTPLQGAVDE
jgi:hypothetical protein